MAMNKKHWKEWHESSPFGRGVDEGDLPLRAEANKKSRVLPGLEKGEVEEGGSGYSSLGALNRRNLQGTPR